MSKRLELVLESILVCICGAMFGWMIAFPILCERAKNTGDKALWQAVWGFFGFFIIIVVVMLVIMHILDRDAFPKKPKSRRMGYFTRTGQRLNEAIRRARERYRNGGSYPHESSP